jgi:hypothetical protein
MPIKNFTHDRETPEEAHARAKENAKREAEQRTQVKAREMQEMMDKQAPPKKEK